MDHICKTDGFSPLQGKPCPACVGEVAAVIEANPTPPAVDVAEGRRLLENANAALAAEKAYEISNVQCYETVALYQIWAFDNGPALLTAAEQVAAMRKALAKYEGVKAGDWFYPDGDTSSEACCDNVDEVLTERYEAQHDGSAIYVIERAVKLPDLHVSVRVFSEEEKAARGSDDDYVASLHLTAEEARTALGAAP